MKWIGQRVQSLISRFRNDVYLESVSTGTIASGGNLGLDSNNKIVKAAEATGDITSVVAGVGLSGGATSGAATLTVDLSEFSDVTPANGDKLATLDSDGSTEQLTTIANLATLFAGTGLTASSSVIGVDAAQSGITSLGTLTGLTIDSDKSVTPGDGAMIHVDASDITDSSTSEESTTAKYTHVSIEAPRLLATNASVTTTDAATLYVSGSVTAHTNQTITNPWALWVDSGNARFDGNIDLEGDIDVNGTLETDALTIGGAAVLAQATASAVGAVELATTAETTTGTDTGRAVTPDGLKDGYQGSANVTTLGTIGTGTWQGTVIASAYLDADTAHYSLSRQFTHHMMTDNIGVDTKVYIALQETDAESGTATNKNLPFLVPGAGKLLKVLCRVGSASTDLTDVTFTWTLETTNTSTNTGAAPSVIGTQSGAGPTGKTMTTYDFTSSLDSGTNVVSAGDTVQLGISADDATGNFKWYVTCVWEFDLS